MKTQDRTINYIEFQVRDIAATKAFYAEAFGWTYTDYGPGYCEFTDGQMKGGFEQTDDFSPKGGALVVLYGDDLVALRETVKKAGGQITRDIFDFPGGQRFHFVDPNGYELAIWCQTTV